MTPPTEARMTGHELQAIREYLALTQDELAAVLGVNPRTTRAWEQDRDPIPYRVPGELARIEAYTEAVIDALADALETAGDDGAALAYRQAPEGIDPARYPLQASPRWWRRIAYVATARTGHPIIGPHDTHTGPIIGPEILTKITPPNTCAPPQ